MKSDKTKSDITPRVIKLIHSVLNYYIVYSDINEAELGKMKKKTNASRSTRSFFVIGFQGKKIPKRERVFKRNFSFSFFNL